ncbi:MAG: hypothetical protein PUE85_00950 [Firmicutes bacterium]|nr:hypothetical protein [Bacillota bacterium]
MTMREMPYPCEIGRYRDYQLTVCGNSSAYPDYEEMNIVMYKIFSKAGS